MPKMGEPIHEFREKIHVIIRTLLQAGVLCEPTVADLCRKSGINSSTLNSTLNSKTGVTIDLQTQLASVARFECNHPAWIDRNISALKRNQPSTSSRTDTASAFEQMLRAKWKLGGYGLQLETTGRCLEPDLATLSVAGGQTVVPGETLSILLQLDFTLGVYKAGYKYGFRGVRIELRVCSATSLKIYDRLGAFPKKQVAIKDANLRGTSNYWDLIKTTDALEGEYATTESPLFNLINSSLGDEFEIKLKAHIADDILVDAYGKRLKSRVKRVIIKKLLLREVFESAEKLGVAWSKLDENHGWLTLASQNCQLNYKAE